MIQCTEDTLTKIHPSCKDGPSTGDLHDNYAPHSPLLIDASSAARQRCRLSTIIFTTYPS